jgi:hypothetical protein
MKQYQKWASFLLIAPLSACSGTDRYVEKPQLTIAGQPTTSQQALQSVFLDRQQDYRIQLCEADANTKECIKDGSGISARGVGGIFLPLFMDMKGIEVSQARAVDSHIIMTSKLDAEINKISPWCGTVEGKVTNDNGSAKITLSDFYCNWAGIGNVLTNIDLSIDSINPADKSFTGFYKISFYGTGNATGSGSFKASIIPSTISTSSHKE